MGAQMEDTVKHVGATREVFDEDFFIYEAKVKMCPRKDNHPFGSCPYLHPNEPTRRRDPRVYLYDSIFCFDLHNNKVCKRGENCPYSHNLLEYFLHDSRFRTRMCEYGAKCKRELCFFAHNESELRERKTVKMHSSCRRRGKNYRQAVAASRFAAEAAAAITATNSASGSTTGSPTVHILQSPALPLPDSSNAARLSLEAPDALATLSLGPGTNAPDQANSQPAAAAAAVATRQQQQQQQPVVVVLQQGVSQGTSEVLQHTAVGSHAAAAAASQDTQAFAVATGTAQHGAFADAAGPAQYGAPAGAGEMHCMVTSSCIVDGSSHGPVWMTTEPQQQVVLQQQPQQIVILQAPDAQLLPVASSAAYVPSTVGLTMQAPVSGSMGLTVAPTGCQYMLVPVAGATPTCSGIPVVTAQQQPQAQQYVLQLQPPAVQPQQAQLVQFVPAATQVVPAAQVTQQPMMLMIDPMQ